VPIDHENTQLYIRHYQRMTRIPVLSELVNWSGLAGNLLNERQSKRVVETQSPCETILDIGDKQIPEDSPIFAYHRRLEELVQAAREEPRPSNIVFEHQA
jgi:hypothetical protein